MAGTALQAGTWWIAPTPFDDEGAVDGPALEAAVRTAVSWGVDGVTVLGVMGEVTSLDDAERATVLAATAAGTGGAVPFAVGCSAASPPLVARRAREAAAHGAVAAMVAAPPLVRDSDAVLGFFGAVGEAAPLPVLLQDEPVATGVALSVTTLVEALRRSGAAAVKLEDAPTPPKISKLLARVPGLTVYGGLGGVSAHAELSRGAAGTMTGFAYPEVLRALRLAFEAGDRARAGRVFDHFLPLIAFEGQPGSGLAVRKELLRRRGALTSARTRGPVPAAGLDPVTTAELDDVLARVGLVPGPEPLDVDAVLAGSTR
ncbi:dihydrodipicolinate synthase family protein [Microlunatus capsulatus]|uniref:4-hydroxy-tetrahydrodipicolinate synthase n=1 Tax=Microlunatus capsulatus TaxID=99117 RepID=A0ABS4Z2G9_9ACTN|nr:dihydrodipicolinate synthase family protein [Microlunatus capsulatus]MBP2415246.1 4-hydroxy-tetrahydrodipicolinate synthase [Microlunatus capsulatus]